MSALPVVLAPADLDGVRDVLRDWSAAGLVQRFVWTDGAVATVVDGGRARRVALRDVLTSTRESAVVLTVLGAAIAHVAPVARERIDACERLIEESLGHGMTVVRIRATAVLKDVDVTVPTLAIGGWHNVVLSAEQASAPERGRVILDATASTDEIDVHIAASLAGVLGLWAGVETSLFEHAAPSQSPSATIARSFVRSLDSSQIEAELRTAVLSTDAGLPLPRVSGGAEYIEDVPLATASMEEAYWRMFPGVLRGPRQARVDGGVTSIGVFEALSMFFGFLWASIRNAPGAWAASIFRKVKAGVANTVQGAVFGSSDAAFVVVVGGVLPDGRPATWREVGDAVDALATAGSSNTHVPHEDLTALWQAYSAAALTLCDAGERNPALPPVEIGARKGVVRRREDVVPDAAARFTDIPAHLAPVVGAADLAPYQVLEADDLERRLAGLAAQPGAGVAASTALDNLRHWRRQHAASFAVRVGSRIGGALNSARSEVAQILERLRVAGAGDVDDRLKAAQRRLAVVMRVLLISAVVLIAVVGALLGFEVISAGLGWSLIGGLVLAWLISSFLVFVRGQALLFQLLKERRELVGQREADEANLAHALRDTRRLVDAYSQFLRWSSILGLMLADPFGRTQLGGRADEPDLVGLPLSVVVGKAQADPADLEIVAAELRRLAFEPGWLNTVFGAVVRNAHRRLGGRGIEFREAPELLFRQQGDGENSVLPAFAAHLQHYGVDADAGERTWADSIRLLSENPALGQQLVRRVQTAGTTITYAEFMGALENPASSGQRIEDSSLRPDMRIQAGKTEIVTSRPTTVTRGLSRLVLLRQATAGLPAFEFSAHGEQTQWQGDGWGGGSSDMPVL
ncbi:hypothetical protein ACI3KS_01660 [Microbacterium sp. ZW T5_45]|uniref:hypothetical protein n=1 Tax=Microbacterium sp. ZW T5_45 TaxID=3378080 RepID=UPI00385240A8